MEYFFLHVTVRSLFDSILHHVPHLHPHRAFILPMSVKEHFILVSLSSILFSMDSAGAYYISYKTSAFVVRCHGSFSRI